MNIKAKRENIFKKLKNIALPNLPLKGWKFLAFFFLLGLFWGFSAFAFSHPGSSSDPLVSKGWTDKYINESFNKLEQNIASLKIQAAALKKGRHIVLYPGKKEAAINGVAYVLDIAPKIINGTTLLPLRFVGEGLSADVNWDNINKTVTCLKSGVKIILPLNGKTAQVNGKNYTLLAAPVMDSGRVLVPARFIAEAFGATVNWDSVNKRIDIK